MVKLTEEYYEKYVGVCQIYMPVKAKETLGLIIKFNCSIGDSVCWLILEICALPFKHVIDLIYLFILMLLLFPQIITLSVALTETVIPLNVQRQIKAQVGKIRYFQRSTLKSKVSTSRSCSGELRSSTNRIRYSKE